MFTSEFFFCNYSFGATNTGGSLFGNNNAAAKPLFGQTSGTTFGTTNTFGTTGTSFGTTGFGGTSSLNLGGTGMLGQANQAQAQGQQNQGGKML